MSDDVDAALKSWRMWLSERDAFWTIGARKTSLGKLFDVFAELRKAERALAAAIDAQKSGAS